MAIRSSLQQSGDLWQKSFFLASPFDFVDSGIAVRLLKLNLMESADCEPTSASRIRCSSESSAMDSHRSKLNGTLFGMRDWPDCVRGQAALYRNLAEQTDDPVVNHELLALAFVCDEVADNIEDHLTGGEDHAPRGPLSTLS
jgi:hypothetical protein